MKTLLVISSGRCVWDDVEKVTPLIGKHDTLAINDMIMFWPYDLNYAASWHPDLLVSYIKVRTYKGVRNRPVTYGPKPFTGVDHAGRFYEGNIETSGMYGACIGLYLGYDKIILAGVPFDNTCHFYDAPMDHRILKACPYYNRPHKYNYPATKTWEELRDNADNKIRAVSGNLIKCFGELTEEWLES